MLAQDGPDTFRTYHFPWAIFGVKPCLGRLWDRLIISVEPPPTRGLAFAPWTAVVSPALLPRRGRFAAMIARDVLPRLTKFCRLRRALFNKIINTHEWLRAYNTHEWLRADRELTEVHPIVILYSPKAPRFV